MDAKRPLIRFADYWEKRLPDDIFDRFETTNIQLMTGRFWRLLIVDLDGEEAIEEWEKRYGFPKTWISLSGSGTGRHIWYSIPANHPEPLNKVVLWQGSGPHSAVERLCDHSLVVVPPSFHVESGEQYRFLNKWHSPYAIGLPANAPPWLLNWSPDRPEQPNPLATVASGKIILPSGKQLRFDRNQILQGIHNKQAIARGWGLRVVGNPNADGWAPCRALDRPDRNPSCSFNIDHGTFIDHSTGLKLSFFDLGAALNPGLYGNWKDVASALESEL